MNLKIFAIVIVLVFIGFAYSVYSYQRSLIDECVADGHKEYQCVRMLSIQEVSR